MTDPALLSIEVCAALPGRIVRVALQLPVGATVGDALRQAAPALPPQQSPDSAAQWAARGLGVFGRACTADRLLSDGDRVEVYRALVADPKAARHRRALQRKASGRTSS